jgi:hypothetical protein
LTPSARSGKLIAGDGTKNGLPAPNKKLTANLKLPLDRKSPIQVCKPSVPAGVSPEAERCVSGSNPYDHDCTLGLEGLLGLRLDAKGMGVARARVDRTQGKQGDEAEIEADF